MADVGIGLQPPPGYRSPYAHSGAQPCFACLLDKADQLDEMTAQLDAILRNATHQQSVEKRGVVRMRLVRYGEGAWMSSTDG